MDRKFAMSTLTFVFFCDRLCEYKRNLTLRFQKRDNMKFCHVPWMVVLVTVLFVEVHGGKSSKLVSKLQISALNSQFPMYDTL